jgi:Caspase domain
MKGVTVLAPSTEPQEGGKRTMNTLPRWFLTVLCWAAVIGLSDAARAAGTSPRAPSQIKVMFMVQGPGQERSQVVENTLTQAFLRQGYKVIDAAMVSQSLRRHAYLLKQSEIEAAKRLGIGLGADIVVGGEAKSRVVDKTYTLLEGKKVILSQADVSLKAVVASTGRVILSVDNASARKPFDTTGQIALQMAAESAAGRLLQGLEEFLNRDTIAYRLVFLNVNDGHSLPLQQALRNRVKGIRQVNEHGFVQNGLELDVSVAKDQDVPFIQSLFAQLAGLGPDTLEAVAGEGETIYLRKAGGSMPAQPKPSRAPSGQTSEAPSTPPRTQETGSGQFPPALTPAATSSATPSVGATTYSPGYRKSWAVLIGINEYQQWPKLQYAVNDARSVEKLVKGLGFDEIIMILDADATRQRILRVLGDELYAKTQDDDRVFIFFAGHGQTQDLPTGGKDGYIVPVDGDLNDYYSTAISMQQLQGLADRIRAKHMFYAMDACFSGLLLRLRGEALNNRPVDLTTALARQVLTAGGEGEMVSEIGGHGLFTKALMSGLAGAADLNNDGNITASELYHYITPQVREESRNSQKPVFGRLGHGQGEFMFVRK